MHVRDGYGIPVAICHRRATVHSKSYVKLETGTAGVTVSDISTAATSSSKEDGQAVKYLWHLNKLDKHTDVVADNDIVRHSKSDVRAEGNRQ